MYFFNTTLTKKLLPSHFGFPGVPAPTKSPRLDPRLRVSFFEDFFSLENAQSGVPPNAGIGLWDCSGGGAFTVTSLPGGIVIFTPSNIAGNNGFILSGELVGGVSIPWNITQNPLAVMRGEGGGLNAQISVGFGFTDGSSSAQPANTIGFRYGGTGAQFSCVCRKAGTSTAVDTNVPTTAGAFHTFAFFVRLGGSKVEFYIDDKLVATISTNIPTVNMMFGLWDTGGNAARKFDYVGASQDR